MPHTVTPKTAVAKVLGTMTGHYLPHYLHRSGSVAVQVTAPCPRSWCTQVPLALSKCLWRMRFILSAIMPLLPSCFRFSFALGHGYLFLVGSNILSMLFQQLIEILVFLPRTWMCILLLCHLNGMRWQIEREIEVETVRHLCVCALKSLHNVTAAMELKGACSFEEKLWQTCTVCLKKKKTEISLC